MFLDGYCSTVQGLLDWFEVDLGFTESVCRHAAAVDTRVSTGERRCVTVFMKTVHTLSGRENECVKHTHTHTYTHTHTHTHTLVLVLGWLQLAGSLKRTRSLSQKECVDKRVGVCRHACTTRMRVHTHLLVPARMCVDTLVYTHLLVCVSTRLSTHTCSYVCRHACLHTPTRVSTHMQMCRCV